MPDLNEQSLSAGNADSAAAHLLRSPQPHIPRPIWRFRPALKPVGVVKTIKTQIIPKIVLALRKLPASKPEKIQQAEASAVEQFAALVLADEDGAALAYVENLLAQGASVESIFLDLLGPTARQLGTQWEADATDFASVTLGVSRLQRIMRKLGEVFFNEASLAGESILLTAIPGEQHSFGLSMVAEFFRRAGWNISAGPFSTHLELTSLVHDHWFDVVGFSVSSDRRLGELKKQIGDIRRESRNRHIGIMLGGPMTVTYPELVAPMGADMISTDAATAPQQARGLVERMNQQS